MTHPVKPTPRKTREVLVLHGGSLGDCVLALHFARALRAGARVTLVARSSIARWAARHGWIDEARSLDSLNGSYWRDDEASPTQDNADHFDGFEFVVSLLGGPDEPISKNLDRAVGRRLCCIDPLPRPATNAPTRHIVDHWLDAIPANEVVQGVDAPPPPPRTAAMRTTLANRMGLSPGPIVLIHPGSGGTAKCCPLEALEVLVKRSQDTGLNVAWIIGPDEMERHGRPYMTRLELSASVLFEESVETAADLIAGADAYVGMDAGMTHVAALAGVNTVALFGPTDPNVWRPLGRSVHVRPFPTPNADLEDWIQEIERCAHWS